jgi:quercetin dioxygenase-like cupin family protein
MSPFASLTSVAANAAQLAAGSEDVLGLLDPLRLDREALATLLAAPSKDAWSSVELFDGHGAHATLFGLRAGTTIPLHDHPGMTVVCKVLHGRMRIRALIAKEDGAAIDRGEIELGPNDTPTVLRDELHAITAVTDCAFFDFFSPWYDDDTRPCTYWRVAAERDGIVTLAKAED